MTWQEKLQANKHLFGEGRRTWSVEELALAYEIDNEANGLNNRDTGCGSCRRSVISRIRNLVKRLD